MAYHGNAPADVALVVGQDVITTTEIQDATIATADIASDAITATKVDDDGTGFQMGSLGLGTAVSGSHKLTVGGTATFSGDITGTLATASQPNITSVGTLTGLTSSSDVLITGGNALQLRETDTYINSPSSDRIDFRTGGTVALFLDSSQNATFSNRVFINQDATNAYALEIDHEGDAYNAVHIDASALTTGSGLHVYSGAVRTADYPLVEIQDDHGNLGGGYGLKVRVDGNGDLIRGMAQGNNVKWKVTNTGAMEIGGANYDQLKIIGSGSESGIKFIDSGGTTDGFVYASGAEIGFLASNGNWNLKTSSTSATFAGIVKTDKIYTQEGNGTIDGSGNGDGSLVDTPYTVTLDMPEGSHILTATMGRTGVHMIATYLIHCPPHASAVVNCSVTQLAKNAYGGNGDITVTNQNNSTAFGFNSTSAGEIKITFINDDSTDWQYWDWSYVCLNNK